MIDKNSFGRIAVDGKEFRDVKIDREGNVSPWIFTEDHTVTAKDVSELSEGIEVLVVGIGTAGVVSVAKEVEELAGQKGIKLVVEKTPEACRSYNSMSKKNPGKIAAIIHSTC